MIMFFILIQVQNVFTIYKLYKKQYLKIRQNYEEQKIKYGYHLYSNELIILNASKFLPKYDYINIFKINKDINLKIRTNLLKYQLTKFDISIDERIQIWEIFLTIEQIKKNIILCGNA